MILLLIHIKFFNHVFMVLMLLLYIYATSVPKNELKKKVELAHSNESSNDCFKWKRNEACNLVKYLINWCKYYIYLSINLKQNK